MFVIVFYFFCVFTVIGVIEMIDVFLECVWVQYVSALHSFETEFQLSHI